MLETGYCLLAAGLATSTPPPIGVLDYVAVGLVLIGSYLNSWSELQRKWWKAKHDNKGRCYTGGLFRWSMHVNYFGDVVLFSGWTMLTATWWTFHVPVSLSPSLLAMLEDPALGNAYARKAA